MSDPLHRAIDSHVHASPDVVPRVQDALDLSRAAAAAGMRGLVFKSHHFSTVDRVQLLGRVVPGIHLIGGIVLNQTACGGLNVEAVRISLELGGRIVWLPTVSAENHIRWMHRGSVSGHLRNLTRSEHAVPVSRDGGLVPAVDVILRLVADFDAVLGTGHLSPEETRLVVRRACALGVERIVVTHPEAPLVAMPIELQCELARQGAMFERCYLSLVDGMPAEEMLAQIRAVGAKSTILATDLGQQSNVPPVDGMRAYHDALVGVGMSESEWTLMASINPSRLLGVETELEVPAIVTSKETR